jgi:hypothetical protein
MNRWISRKLFLAFFVLGVATWALLIGKMDGVTWITAVTLTNTLYFSANVADKGIIKK